MISVDVWDLIWTIINFTALMILLRIFFWKPMLGLMESREKEVRDNLESARSAREEAEKARSEYEQRLAEAREEARRILQDARKQAEDTGERIVAQARDEAARTLDKARDSIRLEKEQALKEIREEVAGLTLMAASRVIGRTLGEPEHRRLVEDVIEELEVGEGR